MTDLPDPLVPAEVDLRSFETMPLAVQMVRDSRFVSEVKPEAFRAGFLLWCASWHQMPAGSVPDNDVELAKLAGYGFAVSTWKRLRKEALMNFVRCNDGRFYHREVAARALVAWQSRLEHFYERSKERLRKANKARADEKPPRPPLPALTFEQWNERRVAGAVPMEKAEAFEPMPRNSGGSVGGIPPENALKGEGTEQRGNGEGEGEGELKEIPPAPPPPPPPPPAPPPPARALDADEPPGHAPTLYGAITRRLREAGISRASPSNVRFKALVDAGVTAEELLAYVDKALKADDPFAYLLTVVEGERRRLVERGPVPQKPETPWDSSGSGIIAKGVELGVGTWNENLWAAGKVPDFVQYTAKVRKALEQQREVAQ